jgi:tripartite-type tricarboxylate transporter receptor subunit TctC
VAQKLTEEFGKQFYVENHAGAGGNIGAGVAARAAPDGYSLMLTSQVTVINPHLYKSVPYDPDKDFVPVTRIATSPNVLVVHPSVPARTVKELVELIKREPGKYTGYAQPGLGTSAHLSGELFRLTLGLDLPSIPFGGGGPMIQSVVAGHTPIAFSSMPPAAGQIQAGTCARSRSPGEADRQPAGCADHDRGGLSRPDRGYTGRHLCTDRDTEGDRRNPARQGASRSSPCPT